MIKHNDNKRLVIATGAVGVFVAFAFGIAVGHYKIFPFKELRAAKTALLGPSAHAEQRSTEQEGRRINFLNRVDIHKGYSTKPDVVMVGDSITDNAEWAELFPDVSIVNRGIAGDTSAGLLERIDSIIATDANIALIMIGVNDIGPKTTADQIYQNYEKIVDRLLTGGIQPFIQSTLLVGQTRSYRNPVIKSLDARLKELAERRKLVYIDLNSRLAPNGVLEARYTSDGIHLNALGYQAWKEVIAPIVTNRQITSHSNLRRTVAELDSRPQ